MKRILPALAAILALSTACSVPDLPEAPPSAVFDDEDDDSGSASLSKLKKFEKENAIRSSDWYRYITKREIQSGALWIYTKLHDDGDADDVADRICGAYSLYSLDDPDVSVVYVRAKNGMRLAKCGPGA